MVAILIRWLMFLHISRAFTFFLAHGTSAAMIFKVRNEHDIAHIRAMLDMVFDHPDGVRLYLDGLEQ